jgi:RNA polymerase sigma-70 factor (ECF subfamily)
MDHAISTTGSAPRPTAAAAQGGASATAPDIRLLVDRARHGDGEAFGRLYEAYAGTVFGYLQRRVSHRQLAEDLCSEAFARAFARITSFTWQGREISAWLLAIAHNLLVDHYKSARARTEVPTGQVPEPAVPGDSAEQTVLGALERERVRAAVAGLIPAQRECITLRHLDGHSTLETAQIIGRTLGATKMLHHRALRELARTLAPPEQHPTTARDRPSSSPPPARTVGARCH